MNEAVPDRLACPVVEAIVAVGVTNVPVAASVTLDATRFPVSAWKSAKVPDAARVAAPIVTVEEPM